MCVVRSHAQGISDAAFDTVVGRQGYFTAKQSAAEQLVIYSLWSRHRAGQPQGAYSHQTCS
jgi:hypothetical protein